MIHPKIAYIIGESCHGGVVSYASEYALLLTKKGYEIDGFVYETEDSAQLDYLKNRFSNVYQIPNIKKVKSYSRELSRHFAEGKYEIVHGFMNTLNFIPLSVAKRNQVPIRIAENLSTGHIKEPKSLVKFILKPFGRVGATAISANSTLSAKWLYGERGLARCFIVPNPIDVNQFYFDSQLREKTRAKLGLQSGMAIGCIARFEKQKNLLFLIDVFEKAIEMDNRLRLILVGHGSMEDEIKHSVSSKGLDSKVSFLTPDFNRNSFYNALDLFVLPSLYEGMPIVALEAQATNLDCLLSDEITKECSLDGLCSFERLGKGVEDWAHKVVGILSERTQRGGPSCVQGSRYDSSIAGTKLAQYYTSLMEQANR